ncbi:MAG: DUF3849 domain-containing protein [Eubacterium sp.]|nr:DUF3849 domain-containing protein [Eubacterium sp.]
MIYNEIDERIMKYVPKAKQKAINAAWRDADGYWIELKDGYNAGRMDNSGCHTIHEETITELRYQIAGIEVDKAYWEDKQMPENNATESIIYSSTNGDGLMAEIIEQDRFTSLLHIVSGNTKEYAVALMPAFDDKAGTFTSRVTSLFETEESAQEAQKVYELERRKAYYQSVCRDMAKIIEDTRHETYRYDLDKAVKTSFEEYSEEDVISALALYIRQHHWDGRISDKNKDFFAEHLNNTKDENITGFAVEMAHPAVMDGFANYVRKFLSMNEQDLKREMIVEFYTKDKDVRQTIQDAILHSDSLKTDENKLTVYSLFVHLDHYKDVINRCDVGAIYDMNNRCLYPEDKFSYLIIYGDSNKVKSIRDYAESIGAGIEDYNPVYSTLTVRVKAGHEKDIADPARDYGLVCKIETDPMDRLRRLINDYCEAEYGTPANFSNPDHVGIAYTEDEECELPIEVYADIENLRIIKLFNNVEISETFYNNLTDMGDVFLNPSFDDFISFSDDEDMKVQEIKEEYKRNQPKITEDTEVTGLVFKMYSDGSGSAEYNGEPIGAVDYATNEYKVGNRAWDVLSTGAPDDDTVNFEEACRNYAVTECGAERVKADDEIILPEQGNGRK